MSAADIFTQFASGLEALSDDKRTALVKSAKGIFTFEVKTKDGKVLTQTLNLKEGKGSTTNAADKKADITVIIDEATFIDLANGKLNGQKAYMAGKIKTKGNMMLAMKLDSILATLKPKAKL
jgi:putative sterol carrier protein